MSAWHYQPAFELAEAIKKKKISVVSLMESLQNRIQQLNPILTALVATDFEKAIKQAHAADQAIAKGKALGTLHGVPITIKDNLEVVGMPCTAGSKDYKSHMPNRNADVVDSLQAAGAIVIGKSNLPRFADDFQAYNELFGQTNNPWDPSRTSGGSSGGSATAVATGFSALDIGNDIGGSIRIPAHFCGVYGHKPTYGIVPDRGLVPPPPGVFSGDFFFNMDIVSNGPLARSPEDLELIMDLIAQPKANDRKAWKLKLPAAKKKNLSDYKIGIWPDDPACPVEKSISSRIRQVADMLTNAGAIVEENQPKLDFNRCFSLFSSLLNAVMGQAAPHKVFKSWIENEKEQQASPENYQSRQVQGAIQRHRDWLMRDAERQIFRQKWQDYFDQYDVMLCPAVCVNAFPHDHSSWFNRTIDIDGTAYPYSNLMGWPGLTNSVYLPSTVAPIGRDQNGLPIGLQIVGNYLEDKTCIQFAKLLKEVIGGFTPPPQFP